MGVLPDFLVERLNVVRPFAPGEHRPGQVSWGCSHYGYDLRLGKTFKVLSAVSPTSPHLLDPKNARNCWQTLVADKSFVLQPRQSCLAETEEIVTVPPDCLGVVLGKSTYARCFLLVNTTWLEPAWVGKVTLELTNLSDRHLKLYVGEGICQAAFIKGVAPCNTTYASKGGKYQYQAGAAAPVVE